MVTARILPVLLGVFLVSGCSSAPEGTSAVSARPSGIPAGINDGFLDPTVDVDAFVQRWEVESREIFTERHAILGAMEARPGMVVADVGAGTGLFLSLLAAAVGPEGRVMALDISPGFVDHLRERIQRENLGNAEARLSTEVSTLLDRESLDLAFVCDVYHHFAYHEAMLDSLWQSLKPGGTLVIVDFERIPGVSRDWILGHVRAGKDQVRSEIEAAGFGLVEEVRVPGLHENYVLRFRRLASRR